MMNMLIHNISSHCISALFTELSGDDKINIMLTDCI